jgi:DNA-binding response OmpR family regulator
MKKKILVVEDDKTLLEMIAFRLEQEGFKVEKAEDGWQALNIVENDKVDLIISDIMMPNVSGLSLLSVLKEFDMERIPVIVVSALDKADVIMSAMGLGAYDFIIKPINFDELCTRITLLLNKKERTQAIH